MATITKNLPIEFFHFKSKEDIEALMIFLNADSASKGNETWFYFYLTGSDEIIQCNKGDYIAKMGEGVFVVITEEEFENL